MTKTKKYVYIHTKNTKTVKEKKKKIQEGDSIFIKKYERQILHSRYANVM